MKLFSTLRRLYSLDTLDTRFTNSKVSPEAQHAASPSRWRTPEFYFYYVVFIVVIPQMFKVSYDVSKASHPNYPKFELLLSNGWIPGRKVDNSDAQYAGFRDNIPYMFLILIAHPCLRRLYNHVVPIREDTKAASPQPALPNGRVSPFAPSFAAKARLEQRISFDLYFALIFLCALHGFSALKVLFILYMNFSLATRLPQAYVPAVTWVFNIGILFANELCNGYKLGNLAAMLQPMAGGKYNEDDTWGTWIDSYGGIIPRWEILFNLTVLRLISFNLDYYWSLDQRSASALEKKQLDPANLSDRDRVAIPAQPFAFTLRHYFAYALYSPLYLTGPILTFNDYISQLQYPPASLNKARTLLYGIRFCLALLTMELVLHYIYAVAISKANPTWEIYTPFQLSMLGFFHLHIIWLKLLLPWRFFRFWALIDGVDPPENMVRCMSNNYSALAFWRGWHRSFNRWIVRYIYIPLGGSGGPRDASPNGSSARTIAGKFRPVINLLAVFTFVALWHDINLQVLMWGWLITLFVLPEVIGTLMFPAKQWQDRKNTYRVLCGLGAVGNILMMMVANLVGFAVGIDGLKDMAAGIVGSYFGLAFLLLACLALFVGVQVMFEIREDELRNGIRMKC